MTELLKPQNWSGGRKLVAFSAALVAVVLLGILDKMDGQHLSTSINWIVSAFVVGNAAVHIAGKEGNTEK